MKQIKLTTQLVVLLCMVCISAFPQEGQNYDFEVDGLYYRYADDGSGYGNQVKVVNPASYGGDYESSGYEGAVNIPSYIQVRNEYDEWSYDETSYDVIAIDDHAFYNSNITSISIPSSVKTIGSEAFTGCSKLNTITVPSDYVYKDKSYYHGEWGSGGIGLENTPWYQSQADGVVYLGKVAYSIKNFNNYRNIVLKDGTKRIANCFSIKENYQNYRLQSISIPASVVCIGESAFQGCYNLNTIAFPEGLTEIGNSAFKDCSALESLTLPSGLIQLGFSAFENCSGLNSTEVVIPDKVDIFYLSTFLGCGLSSLTLGSGIKCILSRNQTYDYMQRHELYNPDTYSYYEAYYDYEYEEIQRLDRDGFYDYEFTDIYEIQSYNEGNYYDEFEIWKDIYGLDVKKVNVVEGNTVFDSRNNCNAIIRSSTNTLVASSSSTVIPNTVTAIGWAAFKNSDITSVNIPSSVISIDVEAFRGSGLTSVTIPSSVKEMGVTTFANCQNLTTVVLEDGVKAISKCEFAYCTSLTSVSLPSSVVSIGKDAFTGTSLYESQPDGVVYAGTIALGYKGTMPDHTSLSIKDGTTIITSEAFSGCTKLIGVDFPSTLTVIGENAFWHCTALQSITIPSGVTTICKSAFSDCSSLALITIPSSVTSIGSSAFSGTSWYNNQLDGAVYAGKVAYKYKGTMPDNTTIAIEEGTLGITDNAFSFCYGLNSVTIPSSVTNIGKEAFNGCRNLTSVTVEIKTPVSIDYSTFGYDITKAILYVPYGCKAAYEAADYWKDFKEIVEIQPEQTDKESLSVEDVKARSGRTVEMAISLTNESEDLTAFQFDLILPDGISLSVNDKGKYVVSKTSRYEDDSQTLNVSKLEGCENTYRFVCFSMSNEVITGTSGAILNAALTVGESVNEDSYEATITNIVVTKTDGAQLKLNDTKFNIVVNNVIPGDANGDGEVNVTDIVEIVNYIMEKPSDKFVVAAADLNGDGEINVTDIVRVVSIIMSAGTNARKRVSAMEMVENDQMALAVNDGIYSLQLDNEAQYVASQFEIRLSEGQILEGVSLNGKRSDGHLVTYTQTGSSLYKVVVFSTENRPLNGNSGELLSFKVSGNGRVEVSNILFVTNGETEKMFPPLYAGTTGIGFTKTSEAMDVYSLDGRMVRRQVTDTNDLEKGVYIINGKKVIVR